MKINFNNITLDTKQLVALAALVEANAEFVDSLTNNTYTCFSHALGIPQNIVGSYYFEVKKENNSLTLLKAITQ